MLTKLAVIRPDGWKRSEEQGTRHQGEGLLFNEQLSALKFCNPQSEFRTDSMVKSGVEHAQFF